MKIAFIDSGFGGLAFMKDFFDTNLNLVIEFLKTFKSKLIVTHYADSKNMPYGVKGRVELKEIVDEIIMTAINDGNKIIVIACNTASTVLTKEVIQEYKIKFDVDIIEIISQSSKYISSSTPYIDGYKNILILGTQATINSGMYEESIYKLDSKSKIYSYAPMLWEESVEDGIDDDKRYTLINSSLSDLENIYNNKGFNIFENISSIGLYCTHYVFFIPEIIKFLKTKTDKYKDILLIKQGAIFNKIILSSLKDHLIRKKNNFSNPDYIEFISKSNSKYGNHLKTIYNKMYPSCNLNVRFI